MITLYLVVAGSIGSGFISAAILLEELRIAYRGWEDVSVELKAEVDRRRPTLGDGISNELKNAIEMLKTENALKKKENMQR